MSVFIFHTNVQTITSYHHQTSKIVYFFHLVRNMKATLQPYIHVEKAMNQYGQPIGI